MAEIEKRIRQTLRISQEELDRIFDGAVERNRVYYGDTLDKMGLVAEPTRSAALLAEEAAIRAQTLGELTNITRSLGFAVRGMGGTVVPGGIQETYARILDVALVKVQSGATNYTGAVREAIQDLSRSGLQWVDYPTGWHNRIEVATRRAVMTGVGQLSAKYTEALREDIDTDFVEVSAHRGARDVDGPLGFENHKKWQGKVYHIGGAVDYKGVHYKDFYRSTGYGTGPGLGGWNCRHKHYPFVPGVMERTYTDEELRNIDPPPFKFEGREYTAYEATQKQRQLETAMRSVQREINGYKAAGDQEAYTYAKARYRALSAEYSRFSKAAQLPEQRARTFTAEK